MKKNRLEKKANSKNWRETRKKRYKEMSTDNVLGTKELGKYQSMYEQLKGTISGFNFPNTCSGKTPDRLDYISISAAYSNYMNS